MRIKELRKANNLTQQKLADLLGVSRSALASWESGVNYPEVATLEKIADFFSVSTDCILERDDTIYLYEKAYPENIDKTALKTPPSPSVSSRYRKLLDFVYESSEDFDTRLFQKYKSLDQDSKQRVINIINEEIDKRIQSIINMLEEDREGSERALTMIFEKDPFIVEKFWEYVPPEYLPEKFRPGNFTPPDEPEYTIINGIKFKQLPKQTKQKIDIAKVPLRNLTKKH